METTEAITITLLGLGLLMLLMILVAVWRVGGSLLRMERLLSEHEDRARLAEGELAQEAALHQRSPAPARDGAFTEFLQGDPERRSLPKREQAEAYRQWRKERGLNWANS
ncbi:MAG: hypothetical protein K9N23_05390 [Akkermansiaceae bacterium]|nr:hypothetical protein [Akkermansiaceae bacterium]